MSAHTPGPWTIIEHESGMQAIEIEAEGIIIIPDIYGRSSDEMAANARLIAAAPDLLEALKGMLEWARRVAVINPGLEIRNASVAVAKAEGRT